MLKVRMHLDEKLEETLSNNSIMDVVETRKKQFIEKGRSPLEEIFMELVFCTLTANTSAEMGLRCEEGIRHLGSFEFKKLREELVRCRYRFPNTRARFIEFNFQRKELLPEIMKMEERRDILTETFMGIGMKEASHFLRNTGYFQYAILDKHVQRFLSEYYGMPMKIKNRRDYIEAEKIFFELSSSYGLEPGIMDLVVWYIMTGKILK